MAPRVPRGKKLVQNFNIDISDPAGDKIIDPAAFEKFLHDRIKVQGQTGNLGDVVTITRNGTDSIAVATKGPFSKRYLKYLSKKFLKKNKVREYLRVIAVNKNTYKLKYFNISNQEEEAEE
ncbi:60S ribosomal protein L22 [Mycoemilia scoparia]|uniref:Large ribosomal subunit protein eL22 n=1 Tax=Mycoemilia scoparia TaxID=417184 RepID=A0A9W8A9G7_9FUNG|nr:60S ribosomal protein L22 [Mycoemilia scoparia]